MTDDRELVLTFDVDWAPDSVIDAVADTLTAAGVRATWFVTHRSPAVDRLARQPDLFELGIHPNLLPGSTHGETPEAVFRHCAELVPAARSMRTHSLVQSTPLLSYVASSTPLELDSSTYLPHATHVVPLVHRHGDRAIVRVPFVWEDDLEMASDSPCWDLGGLLATGPGLKVVDLHPIHVYLDAPDLGAYHALRHAAPDLTAASIEQLTLHRAQAGTVESFLDQAVAHQVARGGGRRLADLL
jgi:peptidoglycan/xylan/chitin deacetylase (PgdA/CDA1 family)